MDGLDDALVADISTVAAVLPSAHYFNGDVAPFSTETFMFFWFQFSLAAIAKVSGAHRHLHYDVLTPTQKPVRATIQTNSSQSIIASAVGVGCLTSPGQQQT
jgi:hypothetical protein